MTDLVYAGFIIDDNKAPLQLAFIFVVPPLPSGHAGDGRRGEG